METAETTPAPKRQRQEYQSRHDSYSSNPNKDTFFVDDDDDQNHHHESIKRNKPYNSILNLLDDDEQEQQHEKEASRDKDLSAIFTTLERELASPSSPSDGHRRQPLTTSINTEMSDLKQLEHYQDDVETANDGSVATSADEGDENVRSVMRHLLEASDDELGIPNCSSNNENNNNRNDDQSGENINMAPFGFNDNHGFWEIEDEVANYYTELHSELFM